MQNELVFDPHVTRITEIRFLVLLKCSYQRKDHVFRCKKMHMTTCVKIVLLPYHSLAPSLPPSETIPRSWNRPTEPAPSQHHSVSTLPKGTTV